MYVDTLIACAGIIEAWVEPFRFLLPNEHHHLSHFRVLNPRLERFLSTTTTTWPSPPSCTSSHIAPALAQTNPCNIPSKDCMRRHSVPSKPSSLVAWLFGVTETCATVPGSPLEGWERRRMRPGGTLGSSEEHCLYTECQTEAQKHSILLCP